MWWCVQRYLSRACTDVLQAFGGGPLGVAASDTLVRAGCTVSSVYGGTEFGPVTRLFHSIARPPGALDWCEFGPKITKRWRDDGDGKFELELLVSQSTSTCA
jgi:hypothetical protein